MKTDFDLLPLGTVIELYRSRLNAEKAGDTVSIEKLKLQYPALFSYEFENFIENIKEIAHTLDHKYREDFSSMFELNHTCH